MNNLYLRAVPCILAVFLFVGCDEAAPDRVPAGSFVVSAQRDGLGTELVSVTSDGITSPFFSFLPEHSAQSPACAAGGQRVAFETDRGGSSEEPALWFVDRGDARPLAEADGYPITGRLGTWAPDARRIVFATGIYNSYLAIADVDAETVTRLTRGTGTDRIPAWSPDGRQIAFVSDRGGEEQRELFVIAPDGSGIRQITVQPPGSDRAIVQVVWGPGSSDVTVLAALNGGTFDYERTIVDVETGTVRPFPTAPQLAGTNGFGLQTWLPGGTQYVYGTRRGALTQSTSALLNLYDVATGRTTTLIERPRPQSFSLDAAWCPAAP